MAFKLFFKKPRYAKAEFILPEGSVVCGPFQARGNGLVDGRLKGDVNIEGKLIIGKNAEIKGDVHAINLEINGKVYGNVFCADKLVINNSAFVKGNVTAAVFEIDEGALIEGMMIKKTDHAAATEGDKKTEMVIAELPEVNSNGEIKPSESDRTMPAVEPVPEKSTDHDKVVTSWF